VNVEADTITAYVVERQAATKVTRRAYTLTTKDGTERKIPEHTRTVTGTSNAEINRELAMLKFAFRLGQKARKVSHLPAIDLLQENNVRTGFFEDHQLNAVLQRLPDHVRPVIEFAAESKRAAS